MTTTTQDRIECEECEGTGEVEVMLPARSPTQIDPEYAMRQCEECGGTGAEVCVFCHDPATLTGADGEPYCSVACAFADDNWPACIECGEDPQDPAIGPFCGPACEESMNYRAAAADDARDAARDDARMEG